MNKIGLHVLYTCDVPLGHPRVVKLVECSPQTVAEVREAVGPECLIVVRWYMDAQLLDNPQRRAGEWLARYGDAIRAMLPYAPIAFEGYNEVPDDHAEQYAAFEIARLVGLHAMGAHGVVGNWGVGTPDIPVWQVYKRIFEHMQAGDYIGLHEYWANGDDIGNPWHCGRWQLVPELRGQPIIVTECGRDIVEGKGQPGWRKTCKTCGEQEYIADLQKYAALLDKFPNVLGATVFTGGRILSNRWRDFDVNGIWPRVVEMYRDEPAPTPEPKRLRHPLPFSRVSQPFGTNPVYYAQYRLDGHNGLDMAPPRGIPLADWHMQAVCAAHGGNLVTGYSDGYGLYAYIIGDDLDTVYGHLAEIEGGARMVRAGEIIGYAGYSGNVQPPGVAGEHLHFGVRPKPYALDNGYRGYVDPLPYLGMIG